MAHDKLPDCKISDRQRFEVRISGGGPEGPMEFFRYPYLWDAKQAFKRCVAIYSTRQIILRDRYLLEVIQQHHGK